MVGSNKLHQIHLRCEQIFGKREKPFSALPVICTGDFLQLPPVQDSWIFGNTSRPNCCDATAPNKWKLHFKMYRLTQKMRSLDDPNFSALCDRIGVNYLEEEHESTLKDRITQCPNEESNDSFKEGKLAIIVCDNAKREEINDTKLLLIENDSTIFEAKDVCRNADRYDKAAVMNLPYTRTGSLPDRLEVKVDAPVMLTVNTDKSDGLTNGSRGYVVDIDEEREIVWVKFSRTTGSKASVIGRHKYEFRGEFGAVPIKKMKASFSVNPARNSIRIQRSQFPLVLAYAITAHKSQGQTLEEVIVDFSGKGRSAPGSFYVAVTRVKKLSNLFLRSFDRSMIKTSVAVMTELSRLDRNGYGFYKVPLSREVFNFNESDEVKIVYLNVNGLLDADHILDLDSDVNLKCADILCIAETKLPEATTDDRLEITNFHTVCCLDYLHRSMRMIVYQRSDSTVRFNLEMQSNHVEQKTQTVQCDINDLAFCFAYVHPTSVPSGFRKLHEVLRPNEFIVGDLNVDYSQKHGREKLDEFCLENNLSVSTHGWTRNNAQLDHVFIPEGVDRGYKFHVDSFANLYSDHSAVSIRLSQNVLEGILPFSHNVTIYLFLAIIWRSTYII